MRGLGKVFKGAVFIAGLLGLSVSAFAAAGDLVTTVTRASDKVTYYRPAQKNTEELITFAAFKVRIENRSTNTINDVVFTAASFVGIDYQYIGQDGPPPPDLPDGTVTDRVALYDSTLGTTACSVDGAMYQVRCSFRQLKAGDFREFTLYFRAPAASSVPLVVDPIDPTKYSASDYVGLDGQTLYAEGPNGPSSPNNSKDDWLAVLIPLGTEDPFVLNSAVPQRGGKFFTGFGGVPVEVDPFATTIAVPASSGNSTAAIVEGEATTASCLNFLNSCYKSQITVPGVFPSPNYLTIILRLDYSTIKPGVRIESITLKYLPDDANENDLGAYETIGLCGSNGPLNDIPCIKSRTEYKKNYKPNSDLSGDFEWELINTKNGRIQFF